MSGDGHWAACGENTGDNTRIYSDLATGTWALVQSMAAQTSYVSGLKFDYYGTTLISGDRERPATEQGSMNVLYRSPGDLSSSAFVDLGYPTVTLANGYAVGTVGNFDMSDDGMVLFWRNLWHWGILRRTSLQEQFTTVSESTLSDDYGYVTCSPKGDLVCMSRQHFSSDWRTRVYRTKATDENLNLFDSSETNARALIKGSGHVGGDLDVVGDISAASISFDSGVNSISAAVNAATWTPTVVLLTNITGTLSAITNNYYARVGNEVLAHASIVPVSSFSYTAGIVTLSITLPATPSISDGIIGDVTFDWEQVRECAVTYSSSTALVVFDAPSNSGANVITVRLNYIA